jgi:CDP-diacylglycerol--glycerol-3-phosphate 3-phosphatidyltransferase
VTNSVIETATKVTSDDKSLQVRLAAAYLNPTDQLLSILVDDAAHAVHLLTAGYVSHGFRPKPSSSTSSQKGARYIPAVFDTLSRRAFEFLQQSGLQSCSLWFYQRPDWTFHSKGLWLTVGNKSVEATISDASSLAVVTHGSGNYGSRSTYRDMESNLIIILKDSDGAAKAKQMFAEEWNDFCRHIGPADREPVRPLPTHLHSILPWLRSFF